MADSKNPSRCDRCKKETEQLINYISFADQSIQLFSRRIRRIRSSQLICIECFEEIVENKS